MMHVSAISSGWTRGWDERDKNKCDISTEKRPESSRRTWEGNNWMKKSEWGIWERVSVCERYRPRKHPQTVPRISNVERSYAALTGFHLKCNKQILLALRRS
jgi:hypothetical protein